MARQEALERVAPWRFLLFFGVLVCAWAVGPMVLDLGHAVMVGFDLAAAVFLTSCVTTLRHAPEGMRALAERSDANRKVMIVISVVLTIVVFAAIVAELGLRGKLLLIEKLLIVASLILTWTFGNAIYTLHYAHLFYSRDANDNDLGGLEFPGTAEPLMSDFVYFAFTLGVAVQTSDVQVTSRHMRKVVVIHSVIGFFFNLGVLALAINLLGAG